MTEHCPTCGQPMPEGTWLQEERQKRGLSLREAGRSMSIDQGTLWRTENGGVPSLRPALAIARFYGLTVEELAERMGWNGIGTPSATSGDAS